MILPIVILAGGLATRLRPITEKIPKSLIILNNISFVILQLKLLYDNNFKHVHFCLGHLGEKVKKTVENSTFSKKMKITYSLDGAKLLGTGGAIKKALPLLPNEFFVTYGDSYLDIDYKSVENYYYKHKKVCNGLMTVYNNRNNYDNSNVIYKNNKIELYTKKKSRDNMEHIDYGLGILKKAHFIPYPDNNHFDLSEIYEKLSKDNNLIGYESQKRFYEIGSINGIKDLSNYLNINKL